MVYIYSFADTVQDIRNIMQAQNICRLFSELDQMDREWPDSSLTCMQARDRYWEIQTVLDNFKMEDKFSLAREYRKMSFWVGLDNIKNTGNNFPLVLYIIYEFIFDQMTNIQIIARLTN